jgi:hypothetical protein
MEAEAQALEAIALELRLMREAGTTSTQILGFGPAPKTQMYVFCNRKHGGVWYNLNEQSQPVNIEHPALTGYIRKLEFKETIRRAEKSHKLHCYIEADRLYVLESSATVHFSKRLLSAIALLTPDDLRQPITIVPQPSAENPEVLFGNLYLTMKTPTGKGLVEWRSMQQKPLTMKHPLCPRQLRMVGKMTSDYMLSRGDIQKILSTALAKNGIELDSKRFQELFDLFLEGEFEIDQTQQPITPQIEKLAREFIFSSAARAIRNDANPK